jgi:sulfate/thiosulfate transport system ATP-binding protein
MIRLSISVQQVTKQFGAFTALDNVSLEVGDGELVALLGPSGSGKTTLLRIIAGLEQATTGDILFNGQAKADGKRRNPVGFVFQHYALFRHMSVFENVAFGLRVRPRNTRPPKAEIRDRVMNLLELVQLGNLANRYPSQLSGGQRQRVALARALAVEPQVLLLDEPFGALDAKVRQELRRWLRRLHDDLHITSVFVTHDQEEALEVADRVVIMNHGKIEQIGTPDYVYDHPANPFVFNFLGSVNLFHGRVEGGQAHLGEITVHAPEHPHAGDKPAVGFVRPHDIEIVRTRNGVAAIEATIKYINPVGPTVRLELQPPGSDELIEAVISKDEYRKLNLQEGEQVYARPRNLKVFVDDYSI